MPRRPDPLDALKVKHLPPGRYADGNKLYLLVRSEKSAFWVLRYTAGGKLREMGLGPARGSGAVKLAKAREDAIALLAKLRDGLDPLVEREAEAERKKAEADAEARDAITFRQEAEAYVKSHAAGWRNPKHKAQWEATLNAYAYPVLGDLPVGDVSTDDVLKVLEPIWRTKTETASRLRGRIEAILAAATVKGLRKGENPARWRGHLAELLPARGKVAPVQHHAALPFAELPGFFLRLQAADGLGARALELAILTAARTGEVLGATWAEIDLDAALWTIPGARMKAARAHRVPLSPEAVLVLRKLATVREGDFVFAGQSRGRALSNMALLMALRRMNRTDLTAHGFRSTFRDWAAETHDSPSEVVEMALAHAVGDKVEAAYRRGDLFEKRRKLMNDWGEFCTTLPGKTPPAAAG